MDSNGGYQVLLYYKYVFIEDYETFADEHLAFCKELGLKGRILVAEEGINGTVSGTTVQTNKYIETMHNDERFTDMEFKIDPADQHAFKKMFVRPRKELVTLRLEKDINPNEKTGEYLSPQQFYEQMQRDDVLILDARNDYEYEIGHFRGAINPNVKTFRELPAWIKENLSEYKDKKILAYCTGGIRCEKLTGFMLKEGFQNVAQLHGGIVTYGKDENVQGKYFDGKCYVFDERISVPINQHEDLVVANCYHCGTQEDRYVNCANPECNLQHVCCKECEEKYERSCSHECRIHPRNTYEEKNNKHLQQA